MKKYNNNNLLHLKKKLGDIFIFDVMLIKLSQLLYILSNKGKSTLFLEEHNTIIFLITFFFYLKKNSKIYSLSKIYIL